MTELTYPLPPWPHPLPRVPVLAQTQWGLLWVYPDDLIGRTLLGVQGDRDVREGRAPARADGHFWDGDLLLPLYDECARPGVLVVIVGAGYGQDALVCGSKGAKVLAVEAQRDLWQMCSESMTLNVVDVISMRHVAYDGEERFFRPDATTHDPTNRGGLAFVAGEPGDQLGGPLDSRVELLDWPVTLIQVDAQGCDLRALRGLERTIRTWHPVVVFEYEADLAAWHGDRWEDYEDFLQLVGYSWEESKTHRNNFVCRPLEGGSHG